MTTMVFKPVRANFEEEQSTSMWLLTPLPDWPGKTQKMIKMLSKRFC